MTKLHWRNSSNPDLGLKDSYDIFLAMRRRGIRAHGWV